MENDWFDWLSEVLNIVRYQVLFAVNVALADGFNKSEETVSASCCQQDPHFSQQYMRRRMHFENLD